MRPAIAAEDIIIYMYKESGDCEREARLLACAAAYAARRGLPCNGDFSLCRQPKGKPHFPHQPHIHFSVSHSGGYWLAAFHGAPLGVDIQQHKQRNYLALAKRWYHPNEYAAVVDNGEACFFDIWSAKESFCKMDGQGIGAAFTRFSVIEEGRLATACNGLLLRPLKLVDGYSACLCAQSIGQIQVVAMPEI